MEIASPPIDVSQQKEHLRHILDILLKQVNAVCNIILRDAKYYLSIYQAYLLHTEIRVRISCYVKYLLNIDRAKMYNTDRNV